MNDRRGHLPSPGHSLQTTVASIWQFPVPAGTSIKSAPVQRRSSQACVSPATSDDRCIRQAARDPTAPLPIASWKASSFCASAASSPSTLSRLRSRSKIASIAVQLSFENCSGPDSAAASRHCRKEPLLLEQPLCLPKNLDRRELAPVLRLQRPLRMTGGILPAKDPQLNFGGRKTWSRRFRHPLLREHSGQ